MSFIGLSIDTWLVRHKTLRGQGSSRISKVRLLPPVTGTFTPIWISFRM